MCLAARSSPEEASCGSREWVADEPTVSSRRIELPQPQVLEACREPPTAIVVVANMQHGLYCDMH